MISDIEKEFYRESFEKKRIGRGIYNRASRRGYVRGGVKTQSDFLTKKQKEALNGEVKVTNMFEIYKEVENIPTLEVLLKKHKKQEMKNVLKFIKENHRNIDIIKRLGISSGKLYSMYDHFGVKYQKRETIVNLSKNKNKKDYLPKLQVKNPAHNLEDVVKWIDVASLPEIERNNYLIAIKKEYDSTQLSSHFGVNKTSFLAYHKKLRAIVQEIELNNEKEKNEIEVQMKLEEKVDIQKTDILNPKNDVLEINTTMETKVEKNNKFKIDLNWSGENNQIVEKLDAIKNLLEITNSNFKINLLIEEI